MVMSYHIYTFYETEPQVVRIALALSFDLLVVVVFYLLKDRHIAAQKRARSITWATLYVLIVFQLFVNIWAYWHEMAPLRATVSGGIFPLTVALISYISMLREKHIEQERREQERQRQMEEKVLEADSITELAELAEERPFEDKEVPKELVIQAFDQDPSEASHKRFLGCTNRRQVLRWWKKLTKGELI